MRAASDTPRYDIQLTGGVKRDTWAAFSIKRHKIGLVESYDPGVGAGRYRSWDDSPVAIGRPYEI